MCRKKSMIISYNISEFVWALRSSVWVVLNTFLLKDATDRRLVAIKSAYFSLLAYTPFYFSQTLPLNQNLNSN